MLYVLGIYTHAILAIRLLPLFCETERKHTCTNDYCSIIYLNDPKGRPLIGRRDRRTDVGWSVRGCVCVCEHGVSRSRIIA